MGEKYDFGGVATVYGVRCADGKTINTGAFEDCDGKKVPLMWMHQHNSVDHVLGHAILQERGNDVYAFCKLNDTPSGRKARKFLENNDIDALSIYANDLDKKGNNVRHGTIREVSLVLAGANPGALIDSRTLAHAMGYDLDDPNIDDILDDMEEAEIYHGMSDAIDIFDEDFDNIQHSDDTKDTKDTKDKNKESESNDNKSETLDPKEIYNTLNEQQKMLVTALVAQAVEDATDNSDDDEDDNKGGTSDMKHNAFDNDYAMDQPSLTKAERMQLIKDAKRYGSLRDTLMHAIEDDDGILAHAYPTNEDGSEQTYGIADINWLFPEARALTNTPEWIKRDQDWVNELMNSTKHTPFSRVKTVFADITADEARAKGYTKGKKKIEEVFTLLKRSTDPQTIYKKQKLDRDDINDITDFDVVAWIRGEMRMMLNEEIARAVLVGDGRISSSDDKISEDHIRSIYHDDELYAIHVSVEIPATADDDTRGNSVIRAIKKARKDYKGSGNPIYFTTEDELSNMLLLEDADGYFKYKTVEELANVLRVRKIVTVPVMEGLTRTPSGSSDELELAGILVNPNDYNIGADKGGEINNFEDFDIDFNQYKYLIETRISGALVKPKSALVIEYKKTA